MAEYRKQTVIAAGIALVIALSAGLGIYFAQGGLTPTTTSSPIPPVNFGSHPAILVGAETTNSTTGLGLSALLNNATFSSGETITINVSESNTLNRTNSVQSEKDWALIGLSLGGCGSLNYPFGIGVYSGYYDSGNLTLLSNQSSLQFYPPGPYPCPMILVVGSYLFQPLSNNATLGTAPNGPGGTIPMESVVSVNGTWIKSSGSGFNSTYHPFAPGVYTVVAGDEWGDTVFVHFTVQPAPQGANIATISSGQQTAATDGGQGGSASPSNAP
jgi:hypothetical protein